VRRSAETGYGSRGGPLTVRARDGSGNTATKTFTLTVNPASPLVITNGTDQLSDATVGVAYEVGLFPGGGVPPYMWSHVAGTLPPAFPCRHPPVVSKAQPQRPEHSPSPFGSTTATANPQPSSSPSGCCPERLCYPLLLLLT
jgi:hypothetical protein